MGSRPSVLALLTSTAIGPRAAAASTRRRRCSAIGDVAGDGDDAGRSGQLRLCGGEAVGAAGVDGEGVTPLGEGSGECESEALRCSGDDRDWVHCSGPSVSGVDLNNN